MLESQKLSQARAAYRDAIDVEHAALCRQFPSRSRLALRQRAANNVNARQPDLQKNLVLESNR